VAVGLSGRPLLGSADDVAAFQRFAADRQLIDVLVEYPEKLDAEALKALLRPLPPRLYSVASSQVAHEGETHLLISAVRWHAHGRDRKGVASTFLADRRRAGNTLKIYVKPNRHFRLPEAPQLPIIMIGAGTGIAPYRGFVAEREAMSAKGKSWLVFGERNFTHDFLYQLEWQEHVSSGALTRIDLAFSRDQPEKIYVQNRLWKHREALRSWLDDGAHLYVCGDEKGMARDVEGMLARILAESHGRDIEAGRTELKALVKAGRYQRDVY
jgi:sulfite reductase (NADPH) flavoprotein alpha-component